MADGLFTRLNNINKQRAMNEAAQEHPQEEVKEQPKEVQEHPQEEVKEQPKEEVVEEVQEQPEEKPQEEVKEQPEKVEEPQEEVQEQPQEQPEKVEEPQEVKNEEVINEEEVTFYMCEECGELFESECVCECGGQLYEAAKVVVRDGKVQRKQINRKKKKLSAKQKAALAKARKKAHSTGANKARAKSMKVRKRKVEGEECICPECDFVGVMEEIEDGVFQCPDCGAELEVDEEAVQVCDVCGEAKCVCKEECDKNEEQQPIAEGLKIYLEALEVPQEIIDKGQDEVITYLKSEYGVDPVL